MNRIAYLLCEIKGRDFDTRLLIAAHLLNMGVAVVVGQRWGIGENRLIAPKGCYLFPTSNHIQGGGMAQVRAAGHFVIASDEEAFAAVADNVHTEKSLNNTVSALTTTAEISMENCDEFLVTSVTHAELISRQFPRWKKKIRVTGSPRVEIISNLAMPSDSSSEYVLVNTSFPLINSIWHDDTAVRAATEVFGEVAVRKRIEGQKAGMQAYEAVIRWLTDKCRVVIRPHPGENAAYWENHFPDIEVVVDSAPLPWIRGAKALIHASSTTGLEAILMGVPTLNLSPSKEYGDINVLGRISPPVGNVNDAISKLEYFFETGSGLDCALSMNDLFPSKGGLETAKAISSFLNDKPTIAESFNWSRVERTDLQRQKFSVNLEEVMNNQLMKDTRKHGVIQLDDSIFLLNPI